MNDADQAPFDTEGQDPARGGGRFDRLTVLLVEDVDDDAKLIIRDLQVVATDVEVTTVDNETAFVAALGDTPDVIISDLDLPSFNGTQALALRGELAPETPFIVLSGAVTDAEAADVLTRGATDYLLKDRTGRLASAVVQSVDAHRALQARRSAELAGKAVSERWETLISNASDIVAVVDEHVRLVYANQALIRLLGHDPDDALGTSVLDYVHPDDVDATASAVSEALTRDGVGDPVIVRMRAVDGGYRYLETIGNNRLDDPNIRGLVVNGRDVTDRIVADQLQVAEITVLEQIAADEPSAVVFASIADILENGTERCSASFEFASEHFTDRFGRPPASDAVAERYELSTEGATVGLMTLWRPIDSTTTPYDPPRVAAACHLAVVAALGQISRRELLYRSLHDPLTGLGTRSLFLEQIETSLSQPDPIAVLMIDVDRLKWINEGLGHEYGDCALLAFAERFPALLTGNDTVARVGGDEFAVLTHLTSGGPDPSQLAERLLASAREPIDCGGHRFTTSVSIGIALQDEVVSPTELLASAEAAVEVAKTEGRDRVALAKLTSRAEVETRLAVEHDLRAGIGRGELRCHLQPLIHLASGVVHGAEALVRWEHPTRGFLEPGQFMPIAAQSNLIEAVDRWMLETVCDTQVAHDIPVGLTVSLNASVRDLVVPDFATRVLVTLDRHHLPPSAIAIEVSESDAMADFEAVRRNLSTFHRAGVAVHLDDFGTGYSSLSYLHELQIEALKIDQSFVAAMLENAESRALVEAIAAMSRALRLTTIAEGVETQAQADLLAGMGVDYAQGYLYTEPCSVADFCQWMDGRQGGSAAASGSATTRTLVRNRHRVTSTTAPVAVDPDATAARLSAGRALLRVDVVEEAVGVCISLVRDLGGSTIPARLDDGSALPLDCSFGHGEPLLPIAPPGLARLRLEQVLPEVLEDARAAIARIRRHEDLGRQASTDPLTGLLNRRAIEPILARAKPDDVIILFDLDHFKTINDVHGHHAGDDVLIEFSRALRDRSQAGDHFARLGGDEILAALSATTSEGLETFVSRLRTTWMLNRPYEVTFSAGAAWIRTRDEHEALAAADAALYAAKASGRDRLVVDDEPEARVDPLEGPP